MSNANVFAATPDMIPDLPEGGAAAMHPMGQQTMRAPTSGVPRFYIKNVKTTDGFKAVEFVKVLTPGDPKAVADHKVTDALRDIYRPQYEMWRKGMEATPTGTPLEMWPGITPEQILDLKYVNIFTIEQLVECADSNLHRIPMGRTLKTQATNWLKAFKDTGHVEQQRKENESLRNQMKSMEDMNIDLTQKMEAMEKRMAALLAAKPGDAPAPKSDGGVADDIRGALNGDANTNPADPSTWEIKHTGFGKWSVLDGAGEALATGLTKEDAETAVTNGVIPDQD